MMMSKIDRLMEGGYEAGYVLPPHRDEFNAPIPWTTKIFSDGRAAKLWLEQIATDNSQTMMQVYDDDGNLDFDEMDRAHLQYMDKITEQITTSISDLTAMGHAQRVLHSASKLDAALKSILLQTMEPITKKLHDRLFEGYSPLNSFAAKIDLCHALKIIDPTIYSELRTLRNIRNAFAHPKGEPSFFAHEIQIECRKFTAYEDGVVDYFDLYLRSARSLMQSLHAIATKAKGE